MTTDTVKVEIVRDEEGVKIAEYSRTKAAVAELEKRHKGVIFEVATTKGMKAAKDARKELRDLRVALEKKRKDLKAPVLDYTRALDGQAKELTASIEALETPIDEQIKAEEQRKEREKAEREAKERVRIDTHRQVIEAIRNRPMAMIGAKAEEIEAAFNEVQATDLEALEEFSGEAAIVRDEAAGKLHELLTQARESEAAAARQAEEDQRRADELAELEELRRFKAEKEAAEKAKGQEVMEAMREAQQDLKRNIRVPPELLGVDMASGPDETVEQGFQMHSPSPGEPGHRRPIDTSRIAQAASNYRPPQEDMAEVTELRDEHQAKLDRFNEARDDLLRIMEGQLTIESAEQLLGDIIAGEVRHVAYAAG